MTLTRRNAPVFDLDDDFTTFRTLAAALVPPPCQEALDWMESIDGPTTTLGEALVIFNTETQFPRADGSIDRVDQSWGVYTIKLLYDNLTTRALVEFLRKVRNPGSLAQFLDPETLGNGTRPFVMREWRRKLSRRLQNRIIDTYLRELAAQELG